MRTLIFNDETQEMFDVTDMLYKSRKHWSKHFGFEVTEKEALNVLMEDHNCTRYECSNLDWCKYCKRPGIYCICP
jgi:hypothetical protein